MDASVTTTDAAGNSDRQPTTRVTRSIPTSPVRPPSLSSTTTRTPGVGHITNKTNDLQPVVRVNLPANAVVGDTVRILDGGATVVGLVVLSATDVNINHFIDIITVPLTNGVNYDLTATITDAANNVSDPSAHFTFTVDTVTGAAPTLIELSNSTVPENTANATPIGTFTTTDTDPGDTFTYSLVNNAGGHFAIVGDQLLVNGPLDLEQTGPLLPITVRVTDSDANFHDEVFQIAVTNEPGVTIKGSTKNDKIDATHHVKHQTLFPTGEEDIISGRAGNDKISSLGGNDTVSGGAGNDRLNGGDGVDTLRGGAGNDKITDGLGNDVLTGGAGADKFIFSPFVAGPLATLGTITDFKHSQLDKIDLHLIDANEGVLGNQAFHFITGAAFTQTGQVRYDAASHQLLGNTDGDTDAEFAINLTHVNHLVKGDFVL